MLILGSKKLIFHSQIHLFKWLKTINTRYAAQTATTTNVASTKEEKASGTIKRSDAP